jgi:hypothetical protein
MRDLTVHQLKGWQERPLTDQQGTAKGYGLHLDEERIWHRGECGRGQILQSGTVFAFTKAPSNQ